MKARLIAALLTIVALSTFAAPPADLFASYENTRQGLLKQSLPELRAGAMQLSAAARQAKQPVIASSADALAASKDITAARNAFAALSDEMIRFRKAQKAAAPAVAWCSMAKKSWLQPKGEISNPYYDASMRKCGEFKD